MTTETQVHLPAQEIAEFCKRWQVRELALFGSVLSDDFTPESDIDVLVTFDADARIGLPALVRMQKELKSILGRDVDLVPRDAIEQSSNERRRLRILESARVVYAA
jgi:predicted nucleotidyltransferase